MRSTSSGVASRSCTIRSASSANGPVAAVDDEAGAVGGVDHVLAHRLAGRARARQRASARLSSPATTSTQAHLGGGLKKCMPTTRSGRGTPAAIAVTLSDEVLVASTQSGATMLRELARTARA